MERRRGYGEWRSGALAVLAGRAGAARLHGDALKRAPTTAGTTLSRGCGLAAGLLRYEV
jgi:hypothetical protein